MVQLIILVETIERIQLGKVEKIALGGREEINVNYKPSTCYNCQKDLNIVNKLCKYQSAS